MVPPSGDPVFDYQHELENKAQFVRCRRGEKFHSDCVVQTVKHPTKTMIWSVISGKGNGRLYVVKSVMREDQYKDVLQNRLIPQLEEWFPNGEPYIFMQDGAPCHTARSIKAFWQNKISLLDWPDKSDSSSRVTFEVETYPNFKETKRGNHRHSITPETLQHTLADFLGLSQPTIGTFKAIAKRYSCLNEAFASVIRPYP
ncbi:uncharacterized protein TNCV_4899461 [Trichonephila clavipes]|nr:uncharacterized protein TNCV_4899461 [Trichonephila clavipes]